MKQSHFIFPCNDLSLEGIAHMPQGNGPFPSVVVCHPHPLYGGDMDNNVVVAVCQALVQRSIVGFRFNFRGVGQSTGRHAQGIGEQQDVEAALSFTRAYVVIGAYHFLQDAFIMLPFGKWGVLIVIQLTLFILGCFFDPFGIVILAAPLFFTAISSFGFDPIWFGVVFVVNMEMAYLTPPVGLNLFYMKAVVPEGTTMLDIYRSIVPFVLLQGFGLVLIVIFPQIVLWLPTLVYG